MMIENLEATCTEVFIPYRDAEGRPRLLDTTPLKRRSVSKTEKQLQKLGLQAIREGVKVSTEAEYQAWYSEHGQPFYTAVTAAMSELGACIGDVGRDWADLSDRVLSAVHRPGWRCE